METLTFVLLDGSLCVISNVLWAKVKKEVVDTLNVFKVEASMEEAIFAEDDIPKEWKPFQHSGGLTYFTVPATGAGGVSSISVS